MLLKGMASPSFVADAKPINIAATICAREGKGLTNYGSNGVIIWEESDTKVEQKD